LHQVGDSFELNVKLRCQTHLHLHSIFIYFCVDDITTVSCS